MNENFDICKSCFEWLTDPANVPRLTHTVTEAGQLTRRVTIRDLTEASKQGCRLCQLPLIGFDDPAEDGYTFMRLLATKQSLESPSRECEDFDELVISHYSHEEGGFPDIVSSDPTRAWVSARPGDAAASFITARSVVKDPRSSEATLLIKRQIDECFDKHACCPRHTNPPPFLPTRVIDVDNASRVTDTKGLSGEYTALSYCWGMKDQPVMLSKHIMEDLEGVFVSEELPQTIRDAITVTRNLGIQYLWVDALCIIQDDAGDKNEQIASIKTIYTNAYVTICAASPTVCTAGFFAPFRGAWIQFDDFDEFFIPYRCPDGRISKLLLQPWFMPSLLAEPVWKRAWTLEERLLSPRMLIFGKPAMYWECNSGQWIFDHRRTPEAANSYLYQQTRDICLGNHLQDEEIRSRRRNFWPMLVGTYTSRALIGKRDRLRAIAGLAARFQPVFANCKYMAGLWHGEGPSGKSFLLAHLIWREVGSTVLHERLPKDDTAPSWSWASLETRASWDLAYGLDLYVPLEPEVDDPAEVITCSAEPVSSANPYGQVRNAFLCIRAPLKSAYVKLGDYQVKFAYFPLRLAHDHHGGNFVHAELDPGLVNLEIPGFQRGAFQSETCLHGELHLLSGLEFEVFFLLLRKRTGLVLVKTSDQESLVFRRVGMFGLLDFSRRTPGTIKLRRR